MTAPRLDINLAEIEHNARVLVKRLGRRGISVTGVVKAGLGSPGIARALLRAGVGSLGDSRIENIETMRRARVSAPMMLIRSPMLSQAARVVRQADLSFNTELVVIRRLSEAAHQAGISHAVVLMVELGDLREGIMPTDLNDTVRAVLGLPNLCLMGIGGNLACHSGVSPDTTNMAVLSGLADSVEATFGIDLDLVSGGNSANLHWALGGADTGRINNLRLGESILLGCEPLYRQPIEGLYHGAITLVAEVIEAKIKPARAWGTLAQTAFGGARPPGDNGSQSRAILALGCQDIDPSGLIAPSGIAVLGASGDHLIIDASDVDLAVGSEIRFGLNYSALVRAMTSPFVAKVDVSSVRNTASPGSPAMPRKPARPL